LTPASKRVAANSGLRHQLNRTVPSGTESASRLVTWSHSAVYSCYAPKCLYFLDYFRIAFNSYTKPTV